MELLESTGANKAMNKINLGCGPVGHDDWINVDWGILAFIHKFPLIEELFIKIPFFPQGYRVKWPKNLKLCDCKNGLSFKSDFADYIYTSHFLEHLKRFEAEKLLKESFRVLKTGGVLRIVVPDMELLIKKYMEKDSAFFVNAFNLKENCPLDSFTIADMFASTFYPEFYIREFSGLKKIAASFIRPHLWMYDYGSLSNLLKICGFKDIKRKNFREGNIPDLAKLDVFPEISLYIEAIK